jgi:hypothetical protein
VRVGLLVQPRKGAQREPERAVGVEGEDRHGGARRLVEEVERGGDLRAHQVAQEEHEARKGLGQRQWRLGAAAALDEDGDAGAGVEGDDEVVMDVAWVRPARSAAGRVRITPRSVADCKGSTRGRALVVRLMRALACRGAAQIVLCVTAAERERLLDRAPCTLEAVPRVAGGEAEVG